MRALRIALIALVSLLVLLVALVGVAVLLLDRDALTERYRDRIVENLETTTGRDWAIGPVDLQVFPLAVAAEHVVIAPPEGAPRDRAPLLAIRAIELRVSLWRLVKSLGKDIAIDEVHLLEPRVHVARDRNGRWSFADIQERLARAPEREPGGLEPLLERIELDTFFLEDGALTLRDAAAPGGATEAELSNIDLELEDVALGRPLEVELALALEAKESNVEISFTTTPLRKEIAQGSLPELTELSLRTRDLPLAALAPWLPEGQRARLREARADLDLSAPAVERDRPLAISGEAALRGVKAARGASTFDVVLKPNVEIALDGSSVRIHELEGHVAEQELAVAGAITGIGAALTLHDVVVRAPALDLTAIERVVGGAPEGSEIAGRAAVDLRLDGTLERDLRADLRTSIASGFLATESLTAEGSLEATGSLTGGLWRGRYDLALDVTGAHLRGEAIDKPPDVPAVLRARGTKRGNTYDIEAARLTLDQAEIDARGRVVLAETPSLHITLSGEGLDLARLRRTVTAIDLPEVTPAMLSFSGELKGSPAKDGALALDLESLSVVLGKTKLSGHARIDELAKPDVHFELSGPYVDLDALLPAEEAPKKKEPPKEPVPGEEPSELTAQGRLRAERGVFKGTSFRNLDARLRYAPPLPPVRAAPARELGRPRHRRRHERSIR